MVAHVAQQKAARRAVHDQPDVRVDPNRPEVRVFHLLQPVQFHSGIRRIHLKIKGSHLHSLLFLTSQSGKAVGEGVGNEKIHDLSGFHFELRHGPDHELVEEGHRECHVAVGGTVDHAFTDQFGSHWSQTGHLYT